MAGEDVTSKLDAAKATMRSVSDTVTATARKIGDVVAANRQPGAPLDSLAEWTRDAPLHAVLVAFLVGWMMGRRR